MNENVIKLLRACRKAKAEGKLDGFIGLLKVGRSLSKVSESKTICKESDLTKKYGLTPPADGTMFLIRNNDNNYYADGADATDGAQFVENINLATAGDNLIGMKFLCNRLNLLYPDKEHRIVRVRRATEIVEVIEPNNEKTDK